MGELGTFTKGAPLSKADIAEEGTPFILYGELYTTYDEVANEIIRKTDKNADLSQYSCIGDVVIPTSGETSEEIATATCVMLPNVILAGDLNIFRSSKVDGRIISYIINHVVNRDISRIAQGKSVVHIKANELSKIYINYPDTNEQNKLISFLTMLTKRIEKQRQVIEALKKYKRGLSKAIFSQRITFTQDSTKWLKCNLGDVITLQSGQDFPPSDYNSIGNGLPYMTGASCIIKGKTVVSRWTTKPRCFAYKGDTLLVCKGSGSGTVARLIQDKVHIARQFMSLQCSSAITKDFCYHLAVQLSDRMKMSATGLIEGIDRKTVLNQTIYLPSIHEQKVISAFLSDFDRVIATREQSVDFLISLRAGLLQHLFI